MGKSPYRYFTILGAMRTGSNLLQRTLDQVEGIQAHGELFNPAFIDTPGTKSAFGIEIAERDADPQKFIDAMVTEAGGRTLPGFRLFDGHHDHAIAAVMSDSRAAKIVLKRNPLDSYVSLRIAQETDQWMLMKQRARKSVRIRFDAEEYRTYFARTAAFYQRLERQLKITGQGAFFIEYPEVAELSIINGVFRWLGVEDQLEHIEDTIQRQNPGTLADKVENYEEMVSALAEMGGLHRTGEGSRSDRAAGLRFMHISRRAPLLFAAIPGGANEAILRWMHGIDGADPHRGDFSQILQASSPFITVGNRRALTDWQQTHPGHLAFTVLRHPVARVYDGFMARIFSSGEKTFPRMRSHAAERFGMLIPEDTDRPRDDLIRGGYGPDQHRDAFMAFLDFLRANLGGRTPMRVDAQWAPQHEFVEGFSSAVALGLVMREEDLIAGASYVRKRFDLPNLRNSVLRDRDPEHPFALSEIWNSAIEGQCRTLYARDYFLFGFNDWSPS